MMEEWMKDVDLDDEEKGHLEDIKGVETMYLEQNASNN